MIRRVGLYWSAVTTACVALLVASGGLAAPPGLSITLTGLAVADESCVAAFDIGNDFAGPLDRFSIDVIALDADDKAIDRVVVNLAPLPNTDITAILVPLGVGCRTIARMLIYDVPDCRIEGEAAMRKCHPGLRTRSRTTVPLEK